MAQVHGPLVVLNLRNEDTIYTVGQRTFDRSSPVNVGALMLQHGGGGHHAAGTCQGPNETAETLKQTLNGELSRG